MTTQNRILKRLQEIRARGLLYREAVVGAIDEEARTVELSFSSEIEYQRWFGIEVLGHDPGEVNLQRLNNRAPVLWMHIWEDQRGVIEPGTARVDSDRKGRCVARFSKSAEGEKLFRDIVDGIVTKVSVGYMVHGMKLVEERDGIDVYRITSWEGYEISMVSVPADDGVGVGRKAEIPQEEPHGPAAEDSRTNETTRESQTPRHELTMNEKITRDAQGNLVRAKVDGDGKIVEVLEVIEQAGADVRSAEQRGGDAQLARVRALARMGQEYGQVDLANQFIADGKSVDEFQRELLHKFGTERAKSKPLAEQEADANIGMSQRDLQRYSLLRAVRALAPNATASDRRAAAFELECSETAQRQYGKEAKGILVPSDVLGRAFNAGGAANTPVGATSGSNIVATELRSDAFIDMLRNRTTIMRLGTVMGGLVGNVDIPKQTGGASGFWVGEGANAGEGVPTIGQIGMTPKTVAAYTDITRRLMMQSTPDAEGIVVRDLRNALAQTIDTAGYYGTAAGNQPRGLKNYAGINAVDFAAANPTFAELVAMESEVAADNADIGQLGYVFNARMRGHCKTTPKFGSGTEATIWEPGGTVNGYRAEVTNQVVNGDVFYGNYADLIIAMWGGLDLTVDPYSLSLSGGLRLVVFQDVDFVLRRVESICYGVQVP